MARTSGLTLLALSVGVVALGGCKPDYPKCKEDSHCASHGEVCVNGTCKECRSDGECREGYTCKSNACVVLPQCSADADCHSGLKCHLGKCAPECSSDRECATGERCQQSKCVSTGACAKDVDCPPGNVCENGQCNPAPPPPTTGDGDTEEQKKKRLASCTLERVLFDFNDFALSDAARATLDKNAECMRFRKQPVTISGHADERGTEEYNIVLAAKRADAARRYLAGLGVDEHALKTISYGKERPLDPGHDEAAWARNRRAEFSFP